jgi:hypothetical protein
MQARPWYIVRAPSFAGGVAIAMVVIILLTYDMIPARSCEPKVLDAVDGRCEYVSCVCVYDSLLRGFYANTNSVAINRIRSRFGRFRAVFRPNMRPECTVLAI